MSAAAALATAIATPLIEALVEWLEGKREEEPPALIHLGVSELKLEQLRQRALAARLLKDAE